MPFFRIEPDIYALHGITANPQLPRGVKFKTGRPITAQLPDILEFSVSIPAGEAPRHFLGDTIPVLSARLADALRKAGGDNVQAFPARLTNHATGASWDGYFAINVIGLVDASNLAASKYEVVMDGNDDIPPLLEFSTLVLDDKKSRPFAMFRLLQNGRMWLISEAMRKSIDNARPPEGWGMTTFEVPVI